MWGSREVLDKMFVGTDLTYKMLENNLIVVLSNTLAFQDIKITGKITGARRGSPYRGIRQFKGHCYWYDHGQ